MAGLVSTLLLLIVQYVLLDCTKHALKWVYKPYGIEMCRGLCQESAVTFYYIQEDLSCHRVPANCSGGAIKVSTQHSLTEESKPNHEPICPFQRGLDFFHRKDGETDQDIPGAQQTLATDRKPQQSIDAGSTETDHDITDGQQTVATDREPQQSTDGDRNPCKTQPEVTTEAARTGDAKIDRYQCSWKLTLACQRGDMDLVKSILAHGNTNISCRDMMGRTLVMYAAMLSQASLFNYLVSQCCDLTPVDKRKQNVLHLACVGGNTDIIRKLLVSETCDIESRDKSDLTPIMLAAINGHREVFRLLEGKGCNVSAVDKWKNNVLHRACYRGSVDLVKYILSRNIFSIDVKGRKGRPPVMMAARNGSKGVVQLLVDSGCTLTMVDYEGNNILHVACMGYRSSKVVKYLMTLTDVKGMEKAKNKYGRTPVQVDKYKRYVKLIKGRT